MKAILVLLGLLAACSCGGQTARTLPGGGDGTRQDRAARLIAKAQALRERVAAGKWESARSLAVPDPRRWFEREQGDGTAWRLAPGELGLWGHWDRHFRTRGTVTGWRADSMSATATVQESNDYFRLLDRPPVANEIVYLFDARELIRGVVIRAAGSRPRGRTDEFLAWARVHAPEELDRLMPNGEIDPRGDHPQRFRALLVRWRRAAGLPSDP